MLDTAKPARACGSHVQSGTHARLAERRSFEVKKNQAPGSEYCSPSRDLCLTNRLKCISSGSNHLPGKLNRSWIRKSGGRRVQVDYDRIRGEAK